VNRIRPARPETIRKLRISAIVDGCHGVIVDGVSA
jgi:hypothetical protein